jgi:hypothetical protein
MSAFREVLSVDDANKHLVGGGVAGRSFQVLALSGKDFFLFEPLILKPYRIWFSSAGIFVDAFPASCGQPPPKRTANTGRPASAERTNLLTARS